MSDTPRAAVFLYEVEDVARYLADRPAATRVVTLTPNARVALGEIDLPVTPAASVMSECDHLRVAAAGRRLSRELVALLDAEPDLCTAARETLIHNVQLIATITYRMWFFLGRDGPWMFWDGGTWRETDDRSDAHALLLRTLMRNSVNFRPMLQAMGLRSACRVVNRLAARAIRWRRPVLITGYHYGLKALAEQAAGFDNWLLQVRYGGGWAGIAHALRTMFLAFLGRPGATLIGAASPDGSARAAADRIIAGLKDPIVRRAADHYRKDLAEEVALTTGLLEEFGALIRGSGARSMLAHSLRWADEAALAEAAGKEGVARVLISHGSHTLPDSPAVMEIIRTHARGLLVSPLADASLIQSPHAERLAAALHPEHPCIRSRPIMWGHRQASPIKSSGNVRRILHAGTFKPLWGPRTFMYEMADEFVDGLTTLIKAVEGLPDTEMTIRVRPMYECDIATLEALLPKAANCKIQTGGDFLDDLSKTDLLVSYSSTTIEEAIHARRPVLLWGGAQRYQHLQARTKTPAPDDRGVVYTADDERDLPTMLDAVLNAHAGLPLDDGELRAHVWQGDTMSPQALFARLDREGFASD